MKKRDSSTTVGMTLVFLFVTVLLCCGVVFSFFKFFRIGKIVCSSQFGNCESYIVTNLHKFEGKGFVESMNGVKSTLKGDYRVLNFSVRFKLPNELAVDLIERKASVAVDSGNAKIKLYDRGGVFLGEVEQTQLPKITGTIDTSNLSFVIGIFSDMNSIYKVKAAKVDNAMLTMGGVNGKTVIFPLRGDRDYLLGALSLILSRLPKGYEISTIDLRFKNPVLK